MLVYKIYYKCPDVKGDFKNDTSLNLYGELAGLIFRKVIQGNLLSEGRLNVRIIFNKSNGAIRQ